MSKLEITHRHSAIINKLKKHPASLKEIERHLEQESEIRGCILTSTSKTFKRDLEDIFSLYHCDIQYNRANNEYYIKSTEEDTINNRMLEAFNTFNALNSSVGYNEYVEFEETASNGSENFHGILHAIKNKVVLKINYQSYWSSTTRERNVKPYFLKEFKNLWYLIGQDIDKDEIRTFALDRMKSIEITRKKFVYPVEEEPKSYFDNCYGIISGDQRKPVEAVVLSFHPFQGKYVKSMPLHSSQKIVKDTDEELVIKLYVYPTFDFEMQLLSYGPLVQVLKPVELRDTIKEKLKKALENYR
ncbi:WYL domain-containing protein [Pedobacter sp. PLR]|uniref:helix-turn-helix transcriptional regulator n=1 Tax=Pedobacter sp. PLR TaxID=2994465 RepID=UPI002247ED1C|nr:WYL domain-containing protein [Pedobacter sp. PLR]MCX2454346.1 WYL domain-containing protein [Pedobacter sp. PLR]